MLSLLKEYSSKKVDGFVRAVKSDVDVNDPDNVTYAIMKKQWDSNTGLEVSEISIGINKKDLLAKRDSLVDQIEAIDELLEDLDPDVLKDLNKG